MGRLQLLSVLLIAVVAGLVQWNKQPAAPTPTFEEIRPSLYKLNYWWRMIPGFARMPVGAWLIESSTLLSPRSWVLIDTGTDAPDNQKAVVQGVKAKLAANGGKLRLILVTHGHGDHVGGLSHVLEAFPQANVAFHEMEAPFITGGRQYSIQQGDHVGFNLARKALPPQNATLLPSNEAIQLEGSSGDVASYAKWMSKDVLQYYHLPGHSPGMVAIYHAPTKSMLAADTFMHISRGFPLSEAYKVEPGIPLRLVTPKLKQAKESIKKLAAIGQAETYFASHDCLAGVSASTLKDLAGTL